MAVGGLGREPPFWDFWGVYGCGRSAWQHPGQPRGESRLTFSPHHPGRLEKKRQKRQRAPHPPPPTRGGYPVNPNSPPSRWKRESRTVKRRCGRPFSRVSSRRRKKYSRGDERNCDSSVRKLQASPAARARFLAPSAFAVF